MKRNSDEMKNTVKIQPYIDTDVYEMLQHMKALEHCTINELVNRAVREYTKERSPEIYQLVTKQK